MVFMYPDNLDTDQVESMEGNDINLIDEASNEQCNYTDLVNEFLDKYRKPSPENALNMNNELLALLMLFKHKIVGIVNAFRNEYSENHRKLQIYFVDPELSGHPDCFVVPFFKDANGKSCPRNKDYYWRRYRQKEYFPCNTDDQHVFEWTEKDKLSVLHGVKEQAIEYLENGKGQPERNTSDELILMSKRVQIHTVNIEDLLSSVGSDFEPNWRRISKRNLMSRHTPNTCRAIWNALLKPDINRNDWTDEENQRLYDTVKMYNFQNWSTIAERIPGRSEYQCFTQYQTVVSVRCPADVLNNKVKFWNKEEDVKLLSLIEKYRINNQISWNDVCSEMPNRTRTQCFTRYQYSLNPSIIRTKFTPSEDRIIMKYVTERGENFSNFPKWLLPNRSRVQIRNRYHNTLQIASMVRMWSPEDDEVLLSLVETFGEHDWKQIADIIAYHSRTSCRTRYYVIKKFLDENPQMDVYDLPRKQRLSRAFAKPRCIQKAITDRNDHEWNWYNNLKYSYDYSLGRRPINVFTNLDALNFIKRALCFNPTTNPPQCQSDRLDEIKADRRIKYHNTAITNTPHLYFEEVPPNYCTLLGMRGICIATSSTIYDSTDVADSSNSDTKYREAQELFRNRLHALFYKTALLCRFQPDDVRIEDQNVDEPPNYCEDGQTKYITPSTDQTIVEPTNGCEEIRTKQKASRTEEIAKYLTIVLNKVQKVDYEIKFEYVNPKRSKDNEKTYNGVAS